MSRLGRMVLTIITTPVIILGQSSRDGAAAARMAHNHEVPGSSPGPATKLDLEGTSVPFCFAVNL